MRSSLRPWLRWGLSALLAVMGLAALYLSLFYAWLTATPVGPTRPVVARFNLFCGSTVVCWVLAVAAIYCFRSRPVPTHCCRACGYDLTGVDSGRCPECGHGPTA